RRTSPEIPALHLSGHGPRAVSAAHGKTRCQAPAVGDGHVHGGHAYMDVGLPVSGFHGRPDAPGIGSCRGWRAEPDAAHNDYGLATPRSGFEGRRVRRPSEEHAGRPVRAVYHDVEPAAVVPAGAYARAGR